MFLLLTKYYWGDQIK